MLPAHIIHDILEREQKRRRREQLEELVVDISELPSVPDSEAEDDRGEGETDRGVVILDFTI